MKIKLDALSVPKVPVTIALEAVVPKVSSATEAVVVVTKVAAAEAATKVAAVAASETAAATKAAAVAVAFVTEAAIKAAAVVAADSAIKAATVVATKAEQDHAIKVRTVAVLRATVPVEVHGPSVKNRPIGLKAAAVKTAQVPSTAVPAIPSVVLRASHA